MVNQSFVLGYTVAASRKGIVVDDALSETSENPVQNKVITGKIEELSEELKAFCKNYVEEYINEALEGDY